MLPKAAGVSLNLSMSRSLSGTKVAGAVALGNGLKKPKRLTMQAEPPAAKWQKAKTPDHAAEPPAAKWQNATEDTWWATTGWGGDSWRQAKKTKLTTMQPLTTQPMAMPMFSPPSLLMIMALRSGTRKSNLPFVFCASKKLIMAASAQIRTAQAMEARRRCNSSEVMSKA